MSASAYTVTTEKLTKTYTQTVALHPLDLRVPAGQVLGVVGPTGAGKSVLLRLLAGVETPTGGAIVLHNAAGDASQPRVHAILDWSARAAEQQPVWEYVRGSLSPACAEHAAALLRELDVWQQRTIRYGTFPVAIQRALRLTRALAEQPSLLLLDEPTAGLEALEAHFVEMWLARHLRREGCTALVATRQIEFAQRLCDRITLLYHGQRLADLAPVDLLTLAEGRWYRIEVQGHLDSHWADWLGGWSLEHDAQGRTHLAGIVADQAALNGVLNTVYNLGLRLLSVSCAAPDAEQLSRHLLAQHSDHGV